MLDGRAEVVSYVRDTSVFYLRVRVPQKQGYRSRRIDGVSTLPEAIAKALDTYMDLGTPSIQSLLEEEPKKARKSQVAQPC